MVCFMMTEKCQRKVESRAITTNPAKRVDPRWVKGQAKGPLGSPPLPPPTYKESSGVVYSSGFAPHNIIIQTVGNKMKGAIIRVSPFSIEDWPQWVYVTLVFVQTVIYLICHHSFNQCVCVCARGAEPLLYPTEWWLFVGD